MSHIMDKMVAHVRKTSPPIPEPLPHDFDPQLELAQRYFLHGQFALATTTLLSIPAEFHHVAVVVILRVRVLLAQGYLHEAVKILKIHIYDLDERERADVRLEGGDAMTRTAWELWIKLCFWDEEGMSDEKKREIASSAFDAWKTYLEWTRMEQYTELHTLLYEIIHQLGIGTCNLPVQEWTRNTDALIGSCMDSQSFISVLAILRVRNFVLGPADPSFCNIMLEYFPMLSAHPDISYVEARTRLILYHIYTNGAEDAAAFHKLVEIDEILRTDAEVNGKEDGRGWELRWLIKFYKVNATNEDARQQSDDDKLAILSSLAHEAVTRDFPDFQCRAMSAICVIMLKLNNFEEFLDREETLLQKASRFGRPASFWRLHLQSLFENFPSPEHSHAQRLVMDLQAVMDKIPWNTDPEVEGTGPVGIGLRLIVFTGLAEMLVGIAEMWKARAREMVSVMLEEEQVSGVRIDERSISGNLGHLIGTSRQN